MQLPIQAFQLSAVVLAVPKVATLSKEGTQSGLSNWAPIHMSNNYTTKESKNQATSSTHNSLHIT
jgi:hypothetical protein